MKTQALKVNPIIVMIGCFDSKGEEFEFLYASLKDQGAEVYAIDTGSRGTSVSFPIDKTAEDVVSASNHELSEVLKLTVRGEVLDIMGLGAQNILSTLSKKSEIVGVIGMGGGGGTYLVLKAMQKLPLEIPKLCISTVASKDLSRQVGAQNIMLMPSIVDIEGVNSISKLVMIQAAAAIVGMSKTKVLASIKDKKTIAISIFGNTTECVNYCTEMLEDQGFEVLCFHAVGAGGRTMEALIAGGLIEGVLDITITELADELCSGICSAGPKRLEAAGKMGIPQVVAPGCLDMVNFAQLDTVPNHYAQRLLYNWSPDVTLMRTNEEENIQLGQIIAEKLNQSKGKVAILLPLRGISIVSSEGNLFHRPEIDEVLFRTIKDLASDNIKVLEIDQNINDKQFAEQAVNALLERM